MAAALTCRSGGRTQAARRLVFTLHEEYKRWNKMVCLQLLSVYRFRVAAVVGFSALVGVYILVSSISLESPNPNPNTHPNPRSQLTTPTGACQCPSGSVMLKDYIPTDQYEDVVQRRAQEIKKYKIRNQSLLTKRLYAKANSPLQYPTEGYTVRPMTWTLIPGLGLYAGERSSYKVSLSVSKGVLNTNASDKEANVTGGGTKTLTIESTSLTTVNLMLSSLSYTSSIFHVNTGDLASFRFEDHEAVFPIAIKELQPPILTDVGKDINSKVTITIKTFMHYDKLMKLLDSIRQFYPEIPIIIADDSLERETIEGKNIDQYFMQPEKGWFAGRNLAVSQVTTKYFLWLDDDYLFSPETKIEKFLEVMEANVQLDVVGGLVQGMQFAFSFHYEEGDELGGGCLQQSTGSTSFGFVPGYPHCTIVSGVTNFFLARTDAIHKVGFDPELQREGQQEFFIDGLGSLMVASCKDPKSMQILHQSQTGETRESKQFRYTPQHGHGHRYPLYHFKNNMKCMRFQ